MSTWQLRRLLGVVVTCPLVAIASCDKGGTIATAQQPTARPVKTWTTLAPSNKTVRSYPGIVTANDSVTLSFEVGGRLIEFPVNNGQELKAGDLIGRIDPRDYENRVAAAQALATAADAKLERLRFAYERNAVSEVEVIQQQASRDSAVAQLAIAQKALEDTELRAPYDGVVARTIADQFDEVAAGAAIVAFESTDVMEIEISIPEQDLVHASETSPGTFVATFDSLPGRSIALTLKEVEARADSVTQTYRVGLTAPYPTDVYVLPGMTAEVAWSKPSGRVSPGVFVPVESLFASPNGDTHVWVINPDSMVVSKRHVRVGEISQGSMAIVVDGLEPDELIAAAGVNHLRDGIAVRPLDSEAVVVNQR